MTPEDKTRKIIDAMMDKDYFSQWLGVERIVEGPGFATLRMKVREEMCNGFGILHGGVSFSLADSAFAFASNSRGQQAVSVETSISHTKAVYPGDILTAKAKEENLSRRLAIYSVKVYNQHQDLVALFKGTVYRKDSAWEVQ